MKTNHSQDQHQRPHRPALPALFTHKATLCYMMLSAWLGCGSAWGGQPITFADPNLELAVRQQLGQSTGELTADAVSTLQALSAGEMNIRDLAGLEALSGLNWVNLGGNPLTNLSSLPSLRNLRTLYLGSCSLSNLNFAPNLTQIRELSLDNNHFQDLSPLAGLTNLDTLLLGWWNGAVTNWGELSNLVHLTELQLQGDGILSIDFAYPLHELRSLDLYMNGVRDISPLIGLTNLEVLSIHWNGCTNLPLVAGLTKLRGLNLAGNGLGDVSFLSNLVELRSLLVDNSQLRVLPNLAWWPHLEHLDLTANWITNTLGSASLVAPNLHELYLGHNAFGNVQFLTNLPSIQTLNLDQNGIEEASSLGQLVNLTSLSLIQNHLTDLQSLLSLPNLVSADVRWNDLDLGAGMPARDQIEQLLSRAVLVLYSPQNGSPLSLCQALNAPELSWTTGSDSPWLGSTAVSHDGMGAALSAPLPDGAQSWLETAVDGPGTLIFWWKVSSETNWDFLEFLLDSQTIASLSGQVDWQWQTVFVPAGNHTLRWAYSKDPGCCRSGQDAGWLDEVSYSPMITPTITLQPSNQVVGVDNEVVFVVQATGSAPLRYQWQFNGADLAEATNQTLTFSAATAGQAGNYSVIISNPFGSVTSGVAVLTVNLPLVDQLFDPQPNASVHALAVQPDGKLVIGGEFTTVGGQARNQIARLNADGTLDAGFNPGADGQVICLVLQEDGKIVVGGAFSTLDGVTRDRIARLNADGTLDVGFDPGADGTVNCLVLQPDGKILIGGDFTTLGGATRNRIARLNSDGSVDAGFDPNANSSIISLALQPDGKTLVGGWFTSLAGQDRHYLGRLNADGTLDNDFNPGVSGYAVYAMAMQADGKILVGGDFTVLGGLARNSIGRLNPDGSMDIGFNPGSRVSVYSLAVQSSGKILVGGWFSNLGGQTRNCLGRLNPDGTLDTAFNPGIGGVDVSFVSVQADGAILVGGNFTSLGEQPRNCLGRLNRLDPLTDSLVRDTSGITWQRAGSSPEVWRTTFEYSADEMTWTYLGAGTRIAGGWQLGGLSLQSGGAIRARGYLIGGHYNGSSWFVESKLSTASRPFISQSPSNVTAMAGTTVVFTITAGGTQPLSYTWLKEGLPLADGNHITGTLTPALVLSNVSGGDHGSYSVIITNLYGAVTSAVATLVVLSPTGNLVRDGSFEAPMVPVGFYSSGPLGAWTLTVASEPPRVYLPGDADGANVTDGTQAIDFGWTTHGLSNALSQSLPTTAGLTYALTFDWGSEYDQGTRARVTVGNLDTVIVDNAGPDGRWIQHHAVYAFVANGGDLLTFQQTSDDDWGLVLDNIAVVRADLFQNPPRILTEPASVILNPWQSAAFDVEASGGLPLHFQWQFQGTDLPGATNSSLFLAYIGTGQIGNYQVVITNLYGAITSTVATLSLTNLPSGDTGTFGKLDVKSLLAAGWVSAACTALDIGQISDAFDGNTSSLIRTPAINPLVITLNFAEPQTLAGFSLWFLCGDNRWKVEIASTLADLDSQNPATTYRTLVDWRTDPESQWAVANLPRPVTAQFLRLTLYRINGDGYVHLSEWEIRTQLRVNWMASPDRAQGRLHWSASPYSYYTVQTSPDLTHWLDTETVTANVPAATSSLILRTNRPAQYFRVRQLDTPPEVPFVTKKVLVINYDPILTNHGGVRVHDYFQWGDPHQLTTDYLADLAEVSSNYVRWIPTFVDVNEWPVKADGFTYNENSYLGAWSSNSFHQPDGVDYARIIQQFDLDRRVQNGEVDEVIIWGGPYFGYYESQMVGATAYWCNSPPITHDGVPLYVMMGLNYERGTDCALESFGHRAESILWHVYGSWNSGTNVQHLWDKFTRIQKDAPGLAACGNVHYPPNGVADYDYGNATYVDSFADDWLLNYPNFRGLTRRFNASEWSFDHRLYLKWWFGHMPHQPGRYGDGKLNHWWAYLLDFNRYSESR